MMRLVFLFCAEERELIPQQAVPGLRAELLRLDDQQAAPRSWPTSTARSCSNAGSTPGPGCWRRSGPSSAGLEHDDAHIPAYGGQPVQPRPLPVPRRPQGGDDLAGRRGEPAAGQQPDGAAPAGGSPTLADPGAGRRSRRGPAGQLPGAGHRADRPRLRGPARPHRQAGRRAVPGPGRDSGEGAGDPAGRAGAAGGEGGGRSGQVPQGGDGQVGIRPQEGAQGRDRRRARPPLPHRLPGGRCPVEAGAAVRRAGAARQLRLPGRHPEGERLRHGGDRPAVQRHALHAPRR